MAISFYTYYCSSWYCVRRVKISLFLDNSVFGWGLDLINHCEKNASDNYRCTSQHTLDGKNRNSIEQIRGKAATRCFATDLLNTIPVFAIQGVL